MGIIKHFKQEKQNFVTINYILRYNNFLITIINLGERRHFHTLNRLNKIQILILKGFGNLSFNLASIVEHLKQERQLCFNQPYLDVY